MGRNSRNASKYKGKRVYCQDCGRVNHPAEKLCWKCKGPLADTKKPFEYEINPMPKVRKNSVFKERYSSKETDQMTQELE